MRGAIVLPPDAPPAVAPLVVVEVRDVSLMDAPSVVVAEQTDSNVNIEPGGRVPFALTVPEADAGRTLALRAHVSFAGLPSPKQGDLLSVVHMPLPETGEVDGLEVPVRQI